MLKHLSKIKNVLNSKKISTNTICFSTCTLQDKIVYSSVLEKEKLKIGYKQRKILENIIEKENAQMKLQSLNIKPFPVALKSIGIDTNFQKSEDLIEEPIQKSIKEERKFKIEKSVPKKWMHEYEYFDDGKEENNDDKMYGTPDPQIHPSKIPCSGCGANLHCADISIPGYIPSEIFKSRTDKELKTIICQRCHFLKNYNIALDVTVSAEDYIKTISAIKDKHALAILIVDLLDFPCSIWPEIQNILGTKRPVIVVGNKIDLLPKDSKGYLEHIKKCLAHAVYNAGLSEINVKKVCLVSAKTGYGIEELITQLHKIWSYDGDVYLMGCANVGKSSIFNALLRSDYCKVEASDLVKRATTCPWPGTTLQMIKFPILRPSDFRVFQRYQRLFSERSQRHAEEQLRKDQLKDTLEIKDATLMGHIGMTFKNSENNPELFAMPTGTNPILTLNENSKDYKLSKWCYDTPGVLNPQQIHNLLTTEELLFLNPKEMITPRSFRIVQGMTILLAGLGRLDFLSGNLDFIKISVYSSLKLPIVITHTKYAEEVYDNLLGTDLLGIPTGDEERLKKWPRLKSGDIIKTQNENTDMDTFDIVLSSAGWIGINLFRGKRCEFKAWTPNCRGIFLRKPALIPYGSNLSGQKIRGSLAYRLGKPFIRQ